MAAPATRAFGSVKHHHWALAALVTVALAAGLIRFRRPNVTKLVERALEAAIEAGTGRLYDVTLGSLKVDPQLGSVRVAGLSLAPIGTEFERAGLGQIQIWFRAEELAFEGVDPQKLLENRQFQAAVVRIDSPKLRVHVNERPPPSGPQPQKARESSALYAIPFLAAIDSIELRNGELSFAQDSSRYHGGWRFGASGLNATIVNRRNRRGQPRTTEASIELRNYVATQPLRSVGVRHLQFKWPAGEATVAGLFVRPDSAQYVKLALPSDQIGFSTDTLQLHGLQLVVPPEDTRLEAQMVRLVRPSLRIFHDKGIPRPPSYRLRPLPQVALQATPAIIALDSVVVVGGLIAYSERNAKTRELGTVTFERMDVLAGNLTNDSAWLARDSVAAIRASASLMGEGRVNADFIVPLADTSGSYTFGAVMGPMDATALNAVVQPLTSLEILDGDIDGLRLQVSGNNQTYSGTMELRYHDFTARLGGHDSQGGSGLSARLMERFEKRMLDGARNPRPGQPLRAGDIYWSRDPSRSIFYNWWKSVLSGIESSVLRAATAGGL